jgi:hypothetical protein
VIGKSRWRIGSVATTADSVTSGLKALEIDNVAQSRPVLKKTALRMPYRFSRVVQLIGLGLIVLTIGVAISVVLDMRQRTEEGYRREIADLSTALAEQTFRYIQEVDPILRELQSRSASLGIGTTGRLRDLMGTASINALLKDRLQNLAQINSLIILDATGQVINSSRDFPLPPVVASDRDFFRHFADHDDQDLFVSAPTTSRVDGTPTVFVARRLTSPHGSFLGVVAGMLDIHYLNEFYRAISTRPGRSVTLLRADGLILTRYPDPSKQTGTWMPKEAPWYRIAAAGSGSYRSPGFLGGPSGACVGASPPCLSLGH